MLSVFKASRSFSLQTSQLGLLTDLSNFNCFETFPIWISVLHAAAVGQEGCAGPEQGRPWHPCPGDRVGDTPVFGGGCGMSSKRGITVRRGGRGGIARLVPSLRRPGRLFSRELGASSREISAPGRGGRSKRRVSE